MNFKGESHVGRIVCVAIWSVLMRDIQRFVIPVQAGIQRAKWIPACAGMTTQRRPLH
jgi:hypothetical protein